MTDTDLEPADSIERLDPATEPPRVSRTGRILIFVFVAFCTAFWMFAFSPWARDLFQAPDQLESESLLAELETTCEATVAELLTLPPALTAETPADRADVLEQANVIVDDLIDELSLVEADNDADARLLRLWLADWEIYFADRLTHVDRLRTEGDVRFLNTIDNGIYVHERMDGFARVNDIPSCETPGDV